MRSGVLVFLFAFGAAIPPGAQGPPYGPNDKIPAAQQKQLAAMLDIVRHADRVEALPMKVDVKAGEMTLGSMARPVENPVPVNDATGRALGRALTSYDWTSWSPSACMFEPGVAFRFTRGTRSAVVEVCFMCGEMALDGIEGRFGEKKILSFKARNAFLRAAKKAFPTAFDDFDEEDPDVKTKG